MCNTVTVHSILWSLCCLVAASTDLSTRENITLTSSNKLVTVNLLPHTPMSLSLQSEPPTDFFIPQCHSKEHNFTLRDPSTSEHETGSSVGDVRYSGARPLTVVNTKNHSFNIFCTYTQYNQSTAPVPGGCNLEFNLENDPNLHIWYDGFQMWIEFQYASSGHSKCNNKEAWSKLEYAIYVFKFEGGGDLSEKTFSEGLSTYILPANIIRKGMKLLTHTRTVSSKPALILTSYPGQGVFIGLVVTDTATGYQASYVSHASYGCDVNVQSNPDVSCQVKPYYYPLTIVLGLMGIFLAFLGHRLFECELFVMGFLTGLLCAFIGLIAAQVSPTGLLLGASGIGVAAGVLWLLVWYAAGIASLSIALTAANTGFLLASIIMFTPLANVSVFRNSWESWIVYAAIVILLIPVILLWNKKVNIACCSFLGSYAAIASVSPYINASLHHIILEPIRRATIKTYYESYFFSGFGTKDGLLVALWIIIMVAGGLAQWRTGRNGPDFPISPRKKRLAKRLNAELEETERLLNRAGDSVASRDSNRRPSPFRTYGTTSDDTIVY